MYNIKANERVFIAGQTGTGKTYLASEMLKDVNRLVVIDTKGELKEQFNISASKKNRREFERGGNARLQIIPPLLSSNEIEPYFDSLFMYLYDMRNFILYIDEVFGITSSAQTVPKYLNAILTRGRSKGIGLFCAVQRPKNIPLVFLSEAQHYFCFRLTLDGDRQRMSEFMGEDVLKRPTDKYGFYYYNIHDDKTQYYKSI